MTQLESVPAAPRPTMTRWHTLILVLLLGAQFMLAVDFSVFNVALPTIGRSVGISLAHVSWISTMFALPTAGLTLLFGRVSDLLGRRRLFLGGLSLLVAASVLGGLAGSPALLLTARLLQGLATAATVPSAFALLVASFPAGPLRERALGMNGTLLSAGFTTGALLGGVFTTALSWRWAFLFNVPAALLIITLTPRTIPESRAEGDVRRLDAPGAFTVTVGLLALIYGVVSAGNAHWSSLTAWLFIAAGGLALAAFLAIEARSEQPLVPLRVLRRRTVAWGNLGGFTVFAMESAMVFVVTIYLQRVLGYSALGAGLLLGGPGIAAVASGLIAPRTIARTGARPLLAGGLLVQGAANLALLTVTGHSPLVPLLLALVVIGFFGHIHALVAFTVTATSDLPDAEQGLATSILTMTQQTAITLGTPVIGTLATASGAGDLTGHVHLAIAVDAAVTIIAATAVGAGLLGRRVPAAGRVSSALPSR